MLRSNAFLCPSLGSSPRVVLNVAMETTEQVRDRLVLRFSGADILIVPNPSPAAQASLLLPPAHAREIAAWLRKEESLQLDCCSNVTGVDWPDKEVVDTVRTTVADPAGGPAKIVEQKTKRIQPGYLEVVYHLYSVALKQGPLILRLRTINRSDAVSLPSLTPVWRSCEFQEREIYDLFGVIFEGHPDLRRILMWDEFQGHPMRRDYVEPDDYEWEPTPHGDVLEKAKKHYPAFTPPTSPVATTAERGASKP